MTRTHGGDPGDCPGNPVPSPLTGPAYSAAMLMLGVVGAGNMGAAIVRGAVANGVVRASELLIVEPDPVRREAMASLGCQVTDRADAVGVAASIMLAVKPQLFGAVARAIGPLHRPAVIISIMAGLESEAIRLALGEEARVVRAMPNMPCQIGAGMTALALGAGAVPGDELLAMRLFDSIGRTVRIDESLMHAATAVCGSGPAYVFAFAEAMEQGALAVGLPGIHARRMVIQTLLGAARMLAESEASPEELRAAVTSRGGTTEAALRALAEGGFAESVITAVAAARDRGRELGRSAPDSSLSTTITPRDEGAGDRLS